MFCRTCIFIAGRPPAEQKEWDEAFHDRSFTASSIGRLIMLKMGDRADNMLNSAESHRQKGHRGSGL